MEAEQWLRDHTALPPLFKVNGKTAYRCGQSAYVGTGNVLWLTFQKNGHWGVFEAHKDQDCTQSVRTGTLIFKTKFVIDDISSPEPHPTSRQRAIRNEYPGDLDWMCYKKKKKTWIHFGNNVMTKLSEVP